MAGLRVVAWNVLKGGGRRVPRIVSALKAMQPNVVVLSEFGLATGHRILDPLADLLPHVLHTPDPTGAGTVLLAIASRHEIAAAEPADTDPVDGHRFQSFDVPSAGWCIGAAYIPGSSAGGERKERFWAFLGNEWEPAVRDRPALLVGDLNTGLHYRDELHATFTCADQLERFETRGWRDAWIERNRAQRPPTSWTGAQGNPYRLDHALLSPTAPRAKSVAYPVNYGDHDLCGVGACSDHTPVIVDLPQR